EVPEVADEVVAAGLSVLGEPRPHLVGRPDQVPGAESGLIGKFGDAPRQPRLADAIYLLVDAALVGGDDDVSLPADADLGSVTPDALTVLGEDLGFSGDVGRGTVEVAPVAVASDEGESAALTAPRDPQRRVGFLHRPGRHGNSVEPVVGTVVRGRRARPRCP